MEALVGFLFRRHFHLKPSKNLEIFKMLQSLLKNNKNEKQKLPVVVSVNHIYYLLKSSEIRHHLLYVIFVYVNGRFRPIFMKNTY